MKSSDYKKGTILGFQYDEYTCYEFIITKGKERIYVSKVDFPGDLYHEEFDVFSTNEECHIVTDIFEL